MVEACIELPVNPGAQLFPFLYSVWFNCGGGGGGGGGVWVWKKWGGGGGGGGQVFGM